MIRYGLLLVLLTGTFLSVNSQGTSPNTLEDSLCFSVNPYHEEQDTGKLGVQFCNLDENTAITILTISGRMVRELKGGGSVPVIWDFYDQYGDKVESGIYIVERKAPGKPFTRDKLYCIMENSGGMEIRRLPR